MQSVVIKKYQNRKLYICKGNTEPVGYINNTGLIDIIRKGKNVDIVDAVTGLDITGEALTACLAYAQLPVDKLLELLRDT